MLIEGTIDEHNTVGLVGNAPRTRACLQATALTRAGSRFGGQGLVYKHTIS